MNLPFYFISLYLTCDLVYKDITKLKLVSTVFIERFTFLTMKLHLLSLNFVLLLINLMNKRFDPKLGYFSLL